MAPRRPNDFLREPFDFVIEHAELTDNLTKKLVKMHRAGRLLSAQYYNETGLTEDNTNAFRISVFNATDADEMAYIDSDANLNPDVGRTLTADTFLAMTIVDGEANFIADDEISLVFNEEGTATLPAGSVRIRGEYL